MPTILEKIADIEAEVSSTQPCLGHIHLTLYLAAMEKVFSTAVRENLGEECQGMSLSFVFPDGTYPA